MIKIKTMDFKQNENKYLFGAFLNTAYDNFNEVLSHIKTVIKTIKNEQYQETEESIEERRLDKNKKRKNFICDVLKQGNASSIKIEKMLNQAFPFWDDLVEIMNHQQPTTAGVYTIFEIHVKCINWVFEALESWRNYTTHYIHPEVPVSPEIILLLNRSFSKGIEIIKQRFAIQDKDLVHLCSMEQRPDGNERRFYIPALHYKFTNDQAEFTEKGLAFFTCLFLYKQDGYHFLNQLKGFKRADEKRYRMTLEAFTVMRFHAPKQLLKLQQQEGDKISLGISMINELGKCPKELYNHLNDNQKRQFEVYAEEKAESCGDEAIGELIRYKDRYETIMLKALEHSSECKNMGFYLGLGKCYMKCYEKHYIDGTIDNRYIVHSLYGFGRLQNSYEASDKYLSKFGEKLHQQSSLTVRYLSASKSEADNSIEVPYISESYPSYVLNNNNIGIKWLNSPEETIYPIFNLAEKKISCPMPDYWLSKYELPAMAFYAYLKEKHNDKLKDLPSVKELITQNQPEKKSKQNNDVSTLLKKRLEKYMEDTTNKLEWLNEKRDLLQDGKLADELVRDILWLQPSSPKEQGKDKLTGANFQTLQYAFARYSFMRPQLPRIFAVAGLTTGPNAHPFLDKIKPESHSTLTDYYANYLSEKKDYISKQLIKIAKGKVNIKFHPLRKLINVPNKAAKLTNAEPIFLSRYLFTETIEKALCQLRGDLKQTINKIKESGRKLNAAKLIEIYLNEYQKDHAPAIYEAERKYACLCYPAKKKEYQNTEERAAHIDKFKKELEDYNQKQKKHSDDEDKCKVNYSQLQKVIDNEKMLRLRKTQDITTYLWMKLFIGENIEQSLSSTTGLLKLQDINASTLAKEVDVKKNTCTPNGNISIEGKAKLKDYGRIIAVIDETLPKSLIHLISLIYKPRTKEKRLPLSYEYLNREINAFYKYRPEVIKMAQDIEDKIVNKLQMNDGIETDGYYNFKKTVNKLTDTNIEKDKLVNIRNGFCHNNYKELDMDQHKELVASFTPSGNIKDTDTLAYYLLSLFKIEYEKVINL